MQKISSRRLSKLIYRGCSYDKKVKRYTKQQSHRRVRRHLQRRIYQEILS